MFGCLMQPFGLVSQLAQAIALEVEGLIPLGYLLFNSMDGGFDGWMEAGHLSSASSHGSNLDNELRQCQCVRYLVEAPKAVGMWTGGVDNSGT
jgi:hypothetical protein